MVLSLIVNVFAVTLVSLLVQLSEMISACEIGDNEVSVLIPVMVGESKEVKSAPTVVCGSTVFIDITLCCSLSKLYVTEITPFSGRTVTESYSGASAQVARQKSKNSKFEFLFSNLLLFIKKAPHSDA